MRTNLKSLFIVILLLSFAATSQADVVAGKILDAQEKP